MDVRAAQAREHHRQAGSHDGVAARHRAQRDQLVRALRREDPGTWTYPTLASRVGCSPQLIAHIIRTTPVPGARK
jgi:AraC-like DNA-binding protein